MPKKSFKRSLEDSGISDRIYDFLNTPIVELIRRRNNNNVNVQPKTYTNNNFIGGGATRRWTNPEYWYNEINGADTLLIPTQRTFNDAFRDARRQGLQTFDFDGKTYTTELGDNPNWEAAGNARRTTSIIPIILPGDTVRKKSNVKRDDVYHPGIGPNMSYANGGSIHIAPSKRGTFTAAANKRHLGVQAFASKVLANKENYSTAMVKKANFAKNASKWNH